MHRARKALVHEAISVHRGNLSWQDVLKTFIIVTGRYIKRTRGVFDRSRLTKRRKSTGIAAGKRKNISFRLCVSASRNPL